MGGAAAAAAWDAGGGGDAAGDICDMQLDAGPSEAAAAEGQGGGAHHQTDTGTVPAAGPVAAVDHNPAASAAPAASAPAPSTPAAATAHLAPAASPAAAPAAAGAAAATPDPATFDLEQLHQLLKQRVEQGVLQDKQAAVKLMKPIGPLPKLATGNLDRQGVLLSTLPQHFQVRPSSIGALPQRLPAGSHLPVDAAAWARLASRLCYPMLTQCVTQCVTQCCSEPHQPRCKPR